MALAVLVVASFALAVVVAGPTTAASGAPANSLLRDDFTRDVSLNTSLWQVNGPVGSVFGPHEVGITVIPLEPAFSSRGMEIAQANTSEVVGTIQSVQNFTPPFTVTAVVEGTVSNGHTFGFAITSANASSGVDMWGNLNPTNCSHLGDCNDTAVCGIPANSAIPPNQCYYGIDGRAAQSGGAWGSKTNLYAAPSVNVTYSLQISVDASGSALFSASQGGQLLGQGTAQVGTGPFYVIIDQGEGAPVAHPGPNQAYWMSVVLTSGAASSTTTSTLPGPSAASIPWFVWLIIIIAMGALCFFIFLWYRRRGFTVKVLDLRTRSPVVEASVMAKGPEKLQGVTRKDGIADFGRVDEGEYTVSITASGYAPSTPVTIKVKKKTEYTERLEHIQPGNNVIVGGTAPPLEPSREFLTPPSPGTQQTRTGVAKLPEEVKAPAVTRPETPPSEGEGPEDLEGWGGGRIGQIIKTFQKKGAISPETALTAEELGLSRLFVRIMKRRRGKTRIFVEINGRYYLNQEALPESR